MGSFVFQILVENLLALVVHAVVHRSNIEHRIEHIIAGNQSAPLGNLPANLHAAQAQIILKKTRPVESRIAGYPRTGGNHMQRSRFPRTVSAIKNRNRLKIDSFKLMP